jgi:hypothetical protein
LFAVYFMVIWFFACFSRYHLRSLLFLILIMFLFWRCCLKTACFVVL